MSIRQHQYNGGKQKIEGTKPQTTALFLLITKKSPSTIPNHAKVFIIPLDDTMAMDLKQSSKENIDENLCKK